MFPKNSLWTVSSEVGARDLAISDRRISERHSLAAARDLPAGVDLQLTDELDLAHHGVFRFAIHMPKISEASAARPDIASPRAIRVKSATFMDSILSWLQR
jgi:hypothetical protein